jgi:hypothetical protein
MLARAAFLALLAAGALAAASPATADAFADQVGQLSPGIEDVRIAGTWSDDTGAGVYRVVIARDGGLETPTRLFVQWIADGGDGAQSVLHSLEIAEVAAENLQVIGYHAESEGDGLSVFIDAMSASGDTGQTYELFVFSPEDYRFGTATN